MQLYSETGNFKLYQGSMLDMLEVIAPCSIDSVVCDPPYGLTSITKQFGNENAAANVYGRDGSFQRLTKGFMGKEWDGSGIELNPDTWRKCYSVLKSGGYLLAFGGTRTFHRIACAIEDAGFEIRDTIMWLYGSGFPKSMNIGLAIDKKNGVESKVIGSGKSGAAETHTKTLHSVSEITGTGWFGGEYEIRQAQNEWAGWGTALKPAYEPVIVARKPCEGSCVDNVLMYGVGGLNIDGCRIPTDEKLSISTSTTEKYGRNAFYSSKTMNNPERTQDPNGRYPANVILTYDETDQAEVCGGMPCENDESAARYYYCAKASKRDRDEGLDAFQEKQTTDGSLRCNVELAPNIRAVSTLHRNTHPTVKPVDLMQYLVRLVTPPTALF